VFTGPDEIKNGVNKVAEVLGGDATARATAFANYYDGNVAKVQALRRGFPKVTVPKRCTTAAIRWSPKARGPS
jgi:hypothetical protein